MPLLKSIKKCWKKPWKQPRRGKGNPDRYERSIPMLIALLITAILYGFSGTSALIAAFDHAKTSIKADVSDKVQRTELLSVIDQAAQVTKEDLKNKKKNAKDLLALAARHDAKAGDIQPVLEKLRSDNQSYQNRIIQYRFALKAKMSREEWAKVFPSGEPSAPRK
jgi:hypothetical protein